MRIGSIGLMMLLAMPGAQAQLPMDIVWQHAPWTFESGLNTFERGLGGGGGSSFIHWCHVGDPSNTLINCSGSPSIEQDFLFDPVSGIPSMFAVNCRVGEHTYGYTSSGQRVWSDLIGITQFIFVGGSNLPCSGSLNGGQYFGGLSADPDDLLLFGSDDNCGWGARVWSSAYQWCACLDRSVGALALHGDTVLACHWPMVTRLDKYTGAVLDSFSVFTDTVTWGRVRTRGDTLFWLVQKLNNELWSGAFLLGGGELWRAQLPTNFPTKGWLFDHHGRAWFATASSFIRQERSDGALQTFPVSGPVLRVMERDGDIYWVRDLGPGNGYAVQCARPWP